MNDVVIIRNAEVFDGQAFIGKRDVVVQGGLIASMTEPKPDGHYAKDNKLAGAKVVDGAGLTLCPGFTDLHCHLRDPGQTWKEDIISGTRSAARGGFTTVVCMPNTDPPVDTAAVVDYIRDKADRSGFARVSPAGCLTKGRGGEQLADLAAMYSAGVRVFTDDGSDTRDTSVFLHCNEFLSMLPGTMSLIHAETVSLANGVMHLGEVSTLLGQPGMHQMGEDLATARAVLTGLYSGQHVHVTHVASKGAVEILRFAKTQAESIGKPGLITCDATFNHLTLTDEAIKQHGTMAKINPPLRSEADRQALLAALADGTLDAIITDHAPHTYDEKMQELAVAPFGFMGFEIALGILNSQVVGQQTPGGTITLERVLNRLTANPAKLLGGNSVAGDSVPQLPAESLVDFSPRTIPVSPGVVEEGELADLVLVDLQQEYEVDKREFVSRAFNTPFLGARAKGRIKLTLCGGRVTFEEGDSGS